MTKYRRKTLTPEILDYLRGAFTDALTAWRCTLIEFGGEANHVHLLIDIHPALDISTLINNLKTASARRVRGRYAEHLNRLYTKPVFWHRAYFAGSVGGVTLDVVRNYVASQSESNIPGRKPGKRVLNAAKPACSNKPA